MSGIPACGDAVYDHASEEGSSSSTSPLLIDNLFTTTFWPHGDVNICFNPSPRIQPPSTVPIPDQAAYNQAKNEVIAALRNGWEKGGRIRFHFDQGCPSPTRTVSLVALPTWENGGGVAPPLGATNGTAEFGYCVSSLPGSNCTRAFCNPTETDCGAFSSPARTTTRTVDPLKLTRAVALHEFGHVLGFRHEHQRTDAPSDLGTWCSGGTAEARNTGDSAFINAQTNSTNLSSYQGPYDRSSVMNYCRDMDNNRRVDQFWQVAADTISAGDRAGAAALYGPATIGSVAGKRLDYFKCAEQSGSCTVGGSKYVAFGANGNYRFKALSGTFACTTTTFGGDPAPGVQKSCHFANFSLATTEGRSGLRDSDSVRDVAYGANGVFHFKRIPAGAGYTCNATTFGGDPVPGVSKACYTPLQGYRIAGTEGGASMSGLSTSAVAFGANGKYVFKILSGSPSCSVATFGNDPVPGVGKNCYRFNASFVVNEWSNYTVPAGHRVYFGSGLNGNFTEATQTSGSCTNNVFGDPDGGVGKKCYSAPAP